MIVQNVNLISSQSVSDGLVVDSRGTPIGRSASTRSTSGAVTVCLWFSAILRTTLRAIGATLEGDGAVTRHVYETAIIEDDKEITVDGDDNNTCCHGETIWHAHEGFEPDSTANFVDEFKRLAEFMGWDKDEQKHQRPEYVDAEFAKFYGAYGQTLDDWQTMCRRCKVEPIPPTIDECVSVSGHSCIPRAFTLLIHPQALKNVLVNIVNLIDNGRNGEPIHVFKLKRAFIDYTWPGRTYPLNRAISNPLMATLLRPVSRRWYSREADKEFKEYAMGQTFS
jgi:hypothetical protein